MFFKVNELAPGDILVWKSHVAIYAGKGMVYTTSNTMSKFVYSRVKDYWLRPQVLKELINMWETRIILCLILLSTTPALSQEYDVHDVLYRSLVGDNVKGNYMGKVYSDQPEILYDDLYLVKRAVVSYKFSPLNVDDGSLPWPLNYNDVEVSFEIIGKYSGKSNAVEMKSFVDVRHIKYIYYKKKFEGISVSEPQFIACSVFIDHVYNTQKELKNYGVENYSNNHKNKILYYKLNNIIGILESDANQSFCNEGFSLVIERTPRKTTKK